MQTTQKLNLEVPGLIVYLLYLLMFTMTPFEFVVPSEVRYSLIEDYRVSHLASNILLFIPFGFLVFRVVKNTAWIDWCDFTRILFCCLLAVILSFVIETYQLFLPRTSELSDVFTNTTGAFLGAVFSKSYYNKAVNAIQSVWDKATSSKHLLAWIVVVYSTVVFILLVFPIRHVDFRNWDPGFPFQLGNEATLDRPWVGSIYLVAVYNRGLSAKEVYTNFESGPHAGNGNRIKQDLIAFYDLKEGMGEVVRDSSGFGSPLNLNILEPSKVKWLAPGGLAILSNTIIKTKGSAEKLYTAMTDTNELTVEAWVKTDNLSQKGPLGGPVRIVSFSKSPGGRNFTLGQAGRDVHLRVRTPRSGLNGFDIHLSTRDEFLTGKVQHLVATYKKGTEKLFVNGMEHSRQAMFDSIKLLGLFGDSLLSKLAFCFFFFFPLSFLSYILFLSHFGETKTTLIFSILTSPALFFSMDLLFVLIFTTKNFDFTLLILVGLVSLFTAFLCRVSFEPTPSSKVGLDKAWLSRV